jgi:hypothetical protein
MFTDEAMFQVLRRINRDMVKCHVFYELEGESLKLKV